MHFNLSIRIRPSWRALCSGLMLVASTALAHKASDSYLTVHLGEHGSVTGDWHLALRDLNDALALDTDQDGAITWGELRSNESAVKAYALAHLHFAAGQERGRVQFQQLLVDNYSDGGYAVLRFRVEALPAAEQLEVDYRAFFDLDPLHRGLLRIESNEGVRLAVFSPQTTCQRFQWHQTAPPIFSLTFLREGIWHIWTGYDHMLFLLALLLPAALRRHPGGWEPRPSFRSVTAELLRTVTAFTVAHSITLSLAAFGCIRLPPRLVESVIAGSVVVAAGNNLVPLHCGRAWLMAFLFGLVHGFGFANALADLGLIRATLARTLLEFNLGVELGQLAIVAAVLPLLYSVRHRPLFARAVLPLASLAIAVIAGAWFSDRAFGSRWLSF